MTKQKRIKAPGGYPLFGWTDNSTRDHIQDKPLVVGDLMIIYNGQGGLHGYSLASVENPSSGKQRRVILSKAAAFGGTSFYRTGKNCYSPRGRSRMLPPVLALMEHLSLDCDLFLDLPPYG